MIDVDGIVRDYLEANGFDGLKCCSGKSRCGCDIGSFADGCDGYWFAECRPAYKIKATQDQKADGKLTWGDFVYTTEKPGDRK